jgi:hypothetical protein
MYRIKYKHLKLNDVKSETHIDNSDLCEVGERDKQLVAEMSGHRVQQAIYLREKGPLEGKAFTLNGNLEWALGWDDADVLCLVPLKSDVNKKA